MSTTDLRGGQIHCSRDREKSAAGAQRRRTVGDLQHIEIYAYRAHYVDVDFRYTPHDKSLFGKAVMSFSFADYMNDVEDVALQFRGICRRQ